MCRERESEGRLRVAVVDAVQWLAFDLLGNCSFFRLQAIDFAWLGQSEKNENGRLKASPCQQDTAHSARSFPGRAPTCKRACRKKGQPKITGFNTVSCQKLGANLMGWRGEPIVSRQGSQKAKAEDWLDPERGTVLRSGRSEGHRPAGRGLPFR